MVKVFQDGGRYTDPPSNKKRKKRNGYLKKI